MDEILLNTLIEFYHNVANLLTNNELQYVRHGPSITSWWWQSDTHILWILVVSDLSLEENSFSILMYKEVHGCRSLDESNGYRPTKAVNLLHNWTGCILIITMKNLQGFHASPHNNIKTLHTDLYRLDIRNVKSAPVDGRKWTFGTSCRRERLNFQLVQMPYPTFPNLACKLLMPSVQEMEWAFYPMGRTTKQFLVWKFIIISGSARDNNYIMKWVCIFHKYGY